MLKVLSTILCDLDPKVKVIGQKAGICDGVPSTSALVHTYYCFGQIRLLSDRTIMGFRRYKPLSEDTIHPTEHYYWSVFIVNNYVLDPGLV